MINSFFLYHLKAVLRKNLVVSTRYRFIVSSIYFINLDNVDHKLLNILAQFNQLFIGKLTWVTIVFSKVNESHRM